MRTVIDQDVCISCGFCAGVCPEVFAMCMNGTVHAKTEEIPEEAEEAVRTAAADCPVSAIGIMETQ